MWTSLRNKRQAGSAVPAKSKRTASKVNGASGHPASGGTFVELGGLVGLSLFAGYRDQSF
jgi:hypothetical protein